MACSAIRPGEPCLISVKVPVYDLTRGARSMPGSEDCHYPSFVYQAAERGRQSAQTRPRVSSIVYLQIAAVLSTALLVGWLTRRYVPAAAKAVYLIDTYTYKPPDRYP